MFLCNLFSQNVFLHILLSKFVSIQIFIHQKVFYCAEIFFYQKVSVDKQNCWVHCILDLFGAYFEINFWNNPFSFFYIRLSLLLQYNYGIFSIDNLHIVTDGSCRKWKYPEKQDYQKDEQYQILECKKVFFDCPVGIRVCLPYKLKNNIFWVEDICNMGAYVLLILQFLRKQFLCAGKQ